MWTLGSYERLECPEEFQDLITEIFGVNDFGGPMFRIIWGQTETLRVSKPEGGYKDQTCGGNLAAWLLQRWVSPNKWLSPKIFKMMNGDPARPGQSLFPYPEEGTYETVHNLGNARLDFEIIHAAIPFLKAVCKMTNYEIKMANDARKAAKDKAETEQIADQLYDMLPSRYGPVSYGRGGCKTSVLDKRMHEIQQVWNQIDPVKLQKRMPKGMAQH